MKHSSPFARARALFSAIAAAGMSAFIGSRTLVSDPNFTYRSRGHGEGLCGNKHAKSSFKQNKRRGL